MSTGAVIGALRVILGLDSAAFETGAKKVEARAGRMDANIRKASKGLQSFGDGLSKYGAKLSVVSVAITGAATAAFGLAASTADTGDKIAKSARSAGVGAEYYQELSFAMGQVTDLAQGELDKGMLTLSRRLGEAKDGSKGAIEAFKAIGISQEDIASGSVNTEQAMDRMIAYLSESTDASTAAKVAQDLFGKAGGRMGAQMAGAAGEIASLRNRAHDLGIVMSKEGLDASEKFGDAWSEVGSAVEGLKIKIADKLLPILVDDFIPYLIETVIPKIGEVVTAIARWIDAFGNLDPMIKDVVLWITGALGVGGPIAIAVGHFSKLIGGLIGFTGPVGLLLLAAVGLGWAWNKWGDDFKAAVGPAIDYVSEKFNAFMKILNRVITKAGEVKTAILEALKLREEDFSLGVSGGAGGRVKVGDAMGGGPVMRFFSLGADMGLGLAEGMITSQDRATAAGAGLVGAAVEGAREAGDINSPSRVMMGVGGDLTDGLAIGIENGTAAPVNAMASAIGQIASTVLGLGDVAEDTFNQLGNWFGDLAKGATTLGQTLQRAVDGWAQSLKQSGLSDFTSIITGGMGPVSGGFVSGLLGNLLGFANGGEFQVGGVGGTDSQIVAFRASPNESVAVTKPGQSFGGGSQMGGKFAVSIGFDDSAGGFTAMMRNEAGQVVAKAASSIVSQSVQQVGRAMRKSKSFGNG